MEKTNKMKYVTLEQGIDFRRIAQIMTDAGYQMNHATARNVLMMSLSHLVRHISGEIGAEVTEDQVKNILRDQKVHEALSDILFEANRQLEEEEKVIHANA
jgi:hypothetical protein